MSETDVLEDIVSTEKTADNKIDLSHVDRAEDYGKAVFDALKDVETPVLAEMVKDAAKNFVDFDAGKYGFILPETLTFKGAESFRSDMPIVDPQNTLVSLSACEYWLRTLEENLNASSVDNEKIDALEKAANVLFSGPSIGGRGFTEDVLFRVGEVWGNVYNSVAKESDRKIIEELMFKPGLLDQASLDKIRAISGRRVSVIVDSIRSTISEGRSQGAEYALLIDASIARSKTPYSPLNILQAEWSISWSENLKEFSSEMENASGA